MTYVVVENCIKCKYMDCVEVFPGECFYEGENMLVIHPDECIDCGVCEPECPAEAIKPDTEPGIEDWLELNREFAAKWPNIARKEVPPPHGEGMGRCSRQAHLFQPGAEPGPALAAASASAAFKTALTRGNAFNPSQKEL